MDVEVDTNDTKIYNSFWDIIPIENSINISLTKGDISGQGCIRTFPNGSLPFIYPFSTDSKTKLFSSTRKLSIKFHPDKNNNDDYQFKKITKQNI